jgi:hypothetical protein
MTGAARAASAGPPPGKALGTSARGFAWDIPDAVNIAHLCCDSWAAVAPDRVAVIHLGADGARSVWTYGDLKRASDRLAAALASRGVMRGDRVAVLMAQHPAVLVAHFAAMKLGAVSLPLFTLFGEDALRYRLRDSGARADRDGPAGARPGHGALARPAGARGRRHDRPGRAAGAGLRRHPRHARAGFAHAAPTPRTRPDDLHLRHDG